MVCSFSLAYPACTAFGWGGRRSCFGQALIGSLVDFPDACPAVTWAFTKLESAWKERKCLETLLSLKH